MTLIKKPEPVTDLPVYSSINNPTSNLGLIDQLDLKLVRAIDTHTFMLTTLLPLVICVTPPNASPSSVNLPTRNVYRSMYRKAIELISTAYGWKPYTPQATLMNPLVFTGIRAIRARATILSLTSCSAYLMTIRWYARMTTKEC